jgi:hypothetical protein
MTPKPFIRIPVGSPPKTCLIGVLCQKKKRLTQSVIDSLLFRVSGWQLSNGNSGFMLSWMFHLLCMKMCRFRIWTGIVSEHQWFLKKHLLDHGPIYRETGVFPIYWGVL